MVQPPADVDTLQSWLHYREFGKGQIQAPVTDNERAVSWLRYMQQKFFAREVLLMPVPGRNDNPPMSLAEIIQQRMVEKPLSTTPAKPTVTAYRQTIFTAVRLGVIVGLILVIFFLVKSRT